MGGLIKGQSLKWQLDTLLGKTSKGPGPYANISRGGEGMSKRQRKEFMARESAKGGEGVLSPLTDRYS